MVHVVFDMHTLYNYRVLMFFSKKRYSIRGGGDNAYIKYFVTFAS